MEKSVNQRASIRTGILVFIVPIVIFLILFSYFHIVPFGDNSLVTSDLNNQYISYFAYFKHHFLDFNYLFGYSYSINLGGSFVGITTYYLLSPFNLLFLMVSVQQFPLIITIITVLKVGFMSIAMYSYLIYRLKYMKNSVARKEDTYMMGLLAIMYALMGYVIVYKSNIMWLDSLIMLPIVMIGLEKLLNRQHMYTYIIALAFTIILNYYVGFIICIFVGIFFLYRFFNIFLVENRLLIERHLILSKFLISSVISGMLSAFILIPGLYSSRYNEALPFSFSLNQRFSPYKILYGLYSGVILNDFDPNLPVIFCGIVVVALLFLYFVNFRKNIKEKFVSVIFLIILTLLQSTEGTYLIWHGFTATNGFFNRNAFIFSFVFIYLASNAWLERSSWGLSDVIKSCAVYILLSLIVFKFSGHLLTSKLLFWNICLFILITCLLVFMARHRFKMKIVFLALTLLALSDVAQNAYQWQKQPRENLTVNKFASFYKRTQAVMTRIKNKDHSFYRIGTTFMRANTDPLMFDYQGLNNYNSPDNLKNIHFLSRLGYFQNYSYWHWMNYNNGSTYGMDSLLGVKYIIDSQNKAYQNIFSGAQSNMGGWNKIDQGPATNRLIARNKTFNVYQNKFALGLISLGNYTILDNSISGNLFERQNKMFNSLDTSAKNIYQPNSVTQVSSNSYKVNIRHSGTLYAYFPVNEQFVTDFNSTDMLIMVNKHKMIEYGTQVENGVVSLGEYHSGQSLNIRLIAADGKHQTEINSLYQTQPLIYTETMSHLSKSIQKIKLNQPTEKIENNKIKFNVDGSKNKVALLSIPYDSGWHAKCNGQIVSVKKGWGNFIAIPLNGKKQNVELNFVPKGLKIGVIISLSGLMGLLSYIFYEKLFTGNKKEIKL